ncbi:hypothetical protein [Xanthobacter sediminis]
MALRIVPEDGYRPLGLKTARPDTAHKPRRERGRQEDAEHLNLVRDLPCLITEALPTAARRNDAAHVRYSSALFGKVNPGVGAKPDDRWVVPLAPHVHQGNREAQHSNGEEYWWEERGINPLRVADQLYAVSAALRMGGAPREDIVRALTNIITRARTDARPGS